MIILQIIKHDLLWPTKLNLKKLRLKKLPAKKARIWNANGKDKPRVFPVTQSVDVYHDIQKQGYYRISSAQ